MSPQRLRDSLRAIIAIVGGRADEQSSDEFLCEAPAEVLHFVRKITAERDQAIKDREHLLNIVCSVPHHETSSSAMAAAYWNWRQTYAPAVNSARALQRKLEGETGRTDFGGPIPNVPATAAAEKPTDG